MDDFERALFFNEMEEEDAAIEWSFHSGSFDTADVFDTDDDFGCDFDAGFIS